MNDADPIRTVDDRTLGRWIERAWTESARAYADYRAAAVGPARDAAWTDADNAETYWKHLRAESDRRRRLEMDE